MPCWTVSTFVVDLGKIDPKLLATGAAEFEGLVVRQTATGATIYDPETGLSATLRYDAKTDAVSVRGESGRGLAEFTSRLKRAHSQAVVRKGARRFRMRVAGESFNAQTKIHRIKLQG